MRQIWVKKQSHFLQKISTPIMHYSPFIGVVQRYNDCKSPFYDM